MTIGRPWAIALLTLLFLSVASNLLVAGFVISRFGPPRPPRDSMIERIVAIGIRAFPPPIQDRIEKGSRDHREELRARLGAVQEARLKMFEAMRADPFDQPALDQAFADFRARTSELQQAGQTIVGGAVAGEPYEVRVEIKPPRGPFP